MCVFSNLLKLFLAKIKNGIQVDRASDVLDTYSEEAVALLTGKMDRNLVYQEALKNTTGDDLSSLNQGPVEVKRSSPPKINVVPPTEFGLNTGFEFDSGLEVDPNRLGVPLTRTDSFAYFRNYMASSCDLNLSDQCLKNYSFNNDHDNDVFFFKK